MRKAKILMLILIGIALVLFLSAGIFMFKSNYIFKNKSCIYREEQYLAVYEGDTADTSVLFIDTNDILNDGEIVDICIVDDNGMSTQMEEYKVDVLSKSSFFSPYILYKITFSFYPRKDIVSKFKYIQINGLQYEVGDIVVEIVAENELQDISIGTSPYAVNNNKYSFIFTNQSDKNVTIKGIEYVMGGNIINLLDKDIIVLAGEECNLKLQTKDIANERKTIKPKIIYEYNENTYVEVVAVATEYVVELSKKDIKEYLKKVYN